MPAPHEGDRGRDAERPGDIPAPGWRDILWRVRHRVVDDRLSIVAAGVAFYAVLAAFPALMALLAIGGLDGLPRQVFDLVRWPVVALIFWGSLLVMYRYGPSRTHPRWSWVSWGAFGATALWLCGSALLSWYVNGFGRYDKPYGAVGLVAIVLVWFLLWPTRS